ncbi:MAG: hypothetical protein D6735_12925, partial [Acidobacteria bacterium]
MIELSLRSSMMLRRITEIFLVCLILCKMVFSQSTIQEAPTPITSNQIIGSIKPRPIGDDRLTRYFYSFMGEQGDIFINVEAENFDGDIDVFVMENLRPLAKITILSANSKTETGRVIYLRKPEKLLLRIEGRTLNDFPATFRIKFAGSFVAIKSDDQNPQADNQNISQSSTSENGKQISESIAKKRKAQTEAEASVGIDKIVQNKSKTQDKKKRKEPKESTAVEENSDNSGNKDRNDNKVAKNTSQPSQIEYEDLSKKNQSKNEMDKSVINEQGSVKKKSARSEQPGKPKSKKNSESSDKYFDNESIEGGVDREKPIDFSSPQSDTARNESTESEPRVVGVNKNKSNTKKSPEKNTPERNTDAKNTATSEDPNLKRRDSALFGMKLIVILRDGKKYEKPMEDILT